VITVAVTLAHQGFGTIVLAFHKAITQAQRQKVNKGQDFLPPEAYGGQGFVHFRRPLSGDAGDPDIQVVC